jgi:hypothetical protein
MVRGEMAVEMAAVMASMELLELLILAVEVVVEETVLTAETAAPVLSLSKSLTLSLPHSLVVSHLRSQLLLRDSTSTR